MPSARSNVWSIQSIVRPSGSVSAGVQQKFDDMLVACIGCHSQWGILYVALVIYWGPFFEQDRDYPGTPYVRSKMQRGFTVVPPAVDVGAMLQENLQGRDVTFFGCTSQRRTAVTIPSGEVRSLFQEQRQYAVIAFGCSKVQRNATAMAANVHADTCVQQDLSNRYGVAVVVTETTVVQRGGTVAVPNADVGARVQQELFRTSGGPWWLPASAGCIRRG